MAKKLFYKIGEACKSLDIQPYVLRYWETEFSALKPNKSKSGQRVYSEQDLGVIRRIKELLYDEGYTIAGAKKKLVSEDLTALEAQPSEPERHEEPTAAAPKPAKAKRASARPRPEPVEAPPPSEPERIEETEETPGKSSAAAGPGLSNEVRGGIEMALKEAKAILALLDKNAGSG